MTRIDELTKKLEQFKFNFDLTKDISESISIIMLNKEKERLDALLNACAYVSLNLNNNEITISDVIISIVKADYTPGCGVLFGHETSSDGIPSITFGFNFSLNKFLRDYIHEKITVKTNKLLTENQLITEQQKTFRSLNIKSQLAVICNSISIYHNAIKNRIAFLLEEV